MISTLQDVSWVLGLRSDALSLIMKAMPFLASIYFYLFLIGVLFWRQRASFTWFLTVLLAFSAIGNMLLKAYFCIPRPLISKLVSVQDSFGFPSGDVQVTLVFWGFLCLIFRNRFLTLFTLILLPLLGFSRIYLGVHTPLDVVGGLCFGGITLAIGWSIWQRIQHTPFYWPARFILVISALLIPLLFRQVDYLHPINIFAAGVLLGCACIKPFTFSCCSWGHAILRSLCVCLLLWGVHKILPTHFGMTFFLGASTAWLMFNGIDRLLACLYRSKSTEPAT